MLPAQHLDVVSRPELLAHTLGGHLDLLAIERIVGQLERHDVAAHRVDNAGYTGLLALKHLDVVAGLQRRFGRLLRCISQQIQVYAGTLGGCLARELEHFVKTRMHIFDLDRIHAHILLKVAIAECLATKHPHTAALRRDFVRVRLLYLFGIEKTRWRTEAQRRERRVDGLLPLASRPIRVRVVFLRRQVNAWHELDAHFLSILGHVQHLRQIARILSTLDTHPAAHRHFGVFLLELEQIGHLEDRHQERLRVRRIGTCESIKCIQHIIGTACLDEDLAIERVSTERRIDPQWPPTCLARQRTS